MKILIDMQGVQTASRHRGIGRYSRATTVEFLKAVHGRHDAGLLFNAALDGIDETVDGIAAEGLHPWRRAYGPLRDVSSDNPGNDARRRAAERIHRHALEASGADVVWMTSVVEGLSEDALVPDELPCPFTVATLYDLIPLHAPEDLGHSRARDWYMRRVEFLRRCDLLLAISSWVRDDAIDRLGLDPERIVAIGAGVDAMFRPAAEGEDHREILKTRLGIDRPFVFYNGGTDRRKNLEVLFHAFAALPGSLRERHRLVVAGRLDAPTRHRLDEAVRASGLAATDVLFPGYVTDEDLVRLYQACDLFVFPSGREGFGLPPLEAMACGAPVIANAATSLPEVVGDPSALFDANMPSSLVNLMRDVLENPQRAVALRESGLRRAALFTWPNVASRALDAIEEAHARSTTRRHASPSGWTSIGSPAEASSAAQVPLPVYLMDRDNGPSLLPSLREWPGLVEWRGPFPPDASMTALDRYRAGGWRAVALPGTTGWADLLGRESIALRVVDRPQDHDARQAWIDALADHPTVRQRLAEDDLALRVATRLDEGDLARAADALDRASSRAGSRWLVDVTHIAVNDLGTGIQRVVRSVLWQWLRSPPEGVRIEPVVFREGRYWHSHAYAASLLGVTSPEGLSEDTVGITGDETFIGLDWAMESLPSSAPVLRTWRRAGVSMHFVAHDMLPVTLPEAFHPQTREAFVRWFALVASLADAIHCISRSTADDVTAWLQANHVARLPRVEVFPLGVEPLRPSVPGILDPGIADAFSARPTLLMVGTIEPRKAHAQALDAMELLWSANADLNLVIVGKRGWLVNELIQRLERHEERGKRLFWFEGCGDETLDAIYEASTALLAPSLGEGFGLPVIEAAQRGKPVIARSLKVFREVAGDYPSYFQGETAVELATYLARWMSDRPVHTPLRNWPDWTRSAEALASAIRPKTPDISS